MSKNAENDAIARLRTESLQQSNTERRMEYYESPCENEKMSSTELRAQIAEKDGRMKAILEKGSSVICGSSDRLFIERLENQMKIAEICAQDMNVEIGESTNRRERGASSRSRRRKNSGFASSEGS